MTNSKRVIVFGANGGIGSQLVQQLKKSGAQVAAVTRSEADRSNPLFDTHVLLPSNTWEGYKDAVSHASEKLGQLDGVVNCIGSLKLKPIHLTREDDFSELVETHLKSSAAILASAIPFLKKSDATDKSVVFISSIAASRGLPNHEMISAVKGAIEAMARSAAATYSGFNIRINSVAPGLTQTPLTSRILANASTRERTEKYHPLGRLGTPEDISNAICWLLSEASNWMTGEVLHIDGGMNNIQNLNN